MRFIYSDGSLPVFYYSQDMDNDRPILIASKGQAMCFLMPKSHSSKPMYLDSLLDDINLIELRAEKKY